MKTIMVVLLVCAVAGLGCGRKSVPSAGMSVNTNTVLPWLPKAELTNQSEVIVHEPSDIDPEDQDRKRIQKMALIDDRKKEDQAGQHTPGN